MKFLEFPYLARCGCVPASGVLKGFSGASEACLQLLHLKSVPRRCLTRFVLLSKFKHPRWMSRFPLLTRGATAARAQA
jgi:hypothetical protein